MIRHLFRSAFAVAGVATLVLISGTAHAQIPSLQYSISNEFRYGIGTRYDQDLPQRKEYLEDLLNTRLYTGDITLGFRIQVDRPREYGKDTLGLTEYFAEFAKEGLRIRGGTFYNLIGRGLIFNTFENRPVGFDTRSEGVKINYETQEFSANGFGGHMRYVNILDTTRVEDYLLRGVSGDVRPIPEVSVGGGYVQATGAKSRSGFPKAFDAYLREGHVAANTGGLNAYLSVSDKRTQLDSETLAATKSDAYGAGVYGMLGYHAKSAGITAEYKNYRFDVVPPNEIGQSNRPTRALPFQNPPTLIPEYDKTLLARNPHTPDFNDELGIQVEGLIYPTEDLTLTLLAAGGSRHNAWRADSVVDSEHFYTKLNQSSQAFPQFSDPMYSPYWEVYAHGEYVASEDLTFALGLQRRDNTIFDEGRGNGAPTLSQIYKATTLMTESVIGLNSHDNLHAILELQHVYDSEKILPADSLGAGAFDGTFNNALLTLEYSHSPRWSVNTRLEFTTTTHEEQGRRIWPVVGGTYRIGDAHTLTMQYGSERGGVVCTGGVCRLINPFTGFRISLVSKL